MIEDRLGAGVHPDSSRELVKKYSFRVLSAADFKAELEAYTGPQGAQWDEFFDQWVYGNGLTDWKVESVRIDGRRGPRPAPARSGGTGRRRSGRGRRSRRSGRSTSRPSSASSSPTATASRSASRSGGSQPVSVPEFGRPWSSRWATAGPWSASRCRPSRRRSPSTRTRCCSTPTRPNNFWKRSPECSVVAALHDARRDRPDQRLRPVERHRRAVVLGADVPRPVVHPLDLARGAGSGRTGRRRSPAASTPASARTTATSWSASTA